MCCLCISSINNESSMTLLQVFNWINDV